MNVLNFNFSSFTLNLFFNPHLFNKFKQKIVKKRGTKHLSAAEFTHIHTRQIYENMKSISDGTLFRCIFLRFFS